MQEHKYAFFDFCETLVSFQTADAFVDYIRSMRKNKRMENLESVQLFLRRFFIIRILEKITGYRLSINKRLKLFQLKGISQPEVEKYSYMYYVDKVKPNFIHVILNQLILLKKEGYHIFLVSGGYDVYLKHFVNEFNLDGIISTRIGFRNGICTGKFNGVDCLNENKIKLLNKVFREKPKTTISFSDSKSDLPFLNWTNEGVVISKNVSQDWAINNNFKEIVWDSVKN